jgi:hypothetical protein
MSKLIDHAYPIAIDGSQKLAGDTLWACVGLLRLDGLDRLTLGRRSL